MPAPVVVSPLALMPLLEIGAATMISAAAVFNTRSREAPIVTELPMVNEPPPVFRNPFIVMEEPAWEASADPLYWMVLTLRAATDAG